MRRALLYTGLLLAVAIGGSTRTVQGATWAGVDETVVEKYAIAAGRPPHAPLLDPGEGDLLLFAFLVAGTVGGFIAGYHFRALFPPQDRPRTAAR
jgi:ABC-type cobalt transport system substrate-binding protein